MFNLFKNDLKQLKHVMVIFICCLLLDYLIGIMSFEKDVIKIMFYLTVFIFSLIIPMINLKYLFNSTKQTHFNSFTLNKDSRFYCSLFEWNYLFNYSCNNILLDNEIKLYKFIIVSFYLL